MDHKVGLICFFNRDENIVIASATLRLEPKFPVIKGLRERLLLERVSLLRDLLPHRMSEVSLPETRHDSDARLALHFRARHDVDGGGEDGTGGDADGEPLRRAKRVAEEGVFMTLERGGGVRVMDVNIFASLLAHSHLLDPHPGRHLHRLVRVDGHDLVHEVEVNDVRNDPCDRASEASRKEGG